MKGDYVIEYYSKFKDKIGAKEINSLFALVDSANVWPLFTTHLLNIVLPHHYSDMLISAYARRSGYCSDNALKYFTDTRFVTHKNTEIYCKTNCERLIYRGGHINEQNSMYGVSWTFNRSVAEEFAFRNNREDSCVYSCPLGSAKVFAFVDNLIDEVIAYPNKTSIIAKHKTDYYIEKENIKNDTISDRLLETGFNLLLMDIEKELGKKLF